MVWAGTLIRVRTRTDKDEQDVVTKECHVGKTNHSGITETEKYLRRQYYWTAMPKSVARVIARCKPCAEAKTSETTEDTSGEDLSRASTRAHRGIGMSDIAPKIRNSKPENGLTAHKVAIRKRAGLNMSLEYEEWTLLHEDVNRELSVGTRLGRDIRQDGWSGSVQCPGYHQIQMEPEDRMIDEFLELDEKLIQVYMDNEVIFSKNIRLREKHLENVRDRKEFVLTTDASQVALGAVLSQREEQPVAFASRKLTPAERRCSTVKKELLAIVRAAKHFRPYMLGSDHDVTIKTDHKPVVWVEKSEETSARISRWKASYDFTIIHPKGSESVVADYLSCQINALKNVDKEYANGFLKGSLPTP
ncbi:hypothetical protein AAG570_013094 [Ranatra chinensis]|uniref:RNA-directed DNA polymerase n=1 Tax=Ranatra chinensis TaxID=642074 RepID=A0ABD0YFR8_9HEMI